MVLSQRKLDILSSAHRASIEAEFRLLRDNWTQQQWLSSKNRYRRDCLTKIKTDTIQGKRVKHNHLREYIAASTITHCMDGWSYLGRAIDSHMRGDPDSSRHLGYYAELRAAMALLATEGIGIFSNVHFVVDKRSRCNVLRGGGTHRFIWPALEHWSSLPSAVELLFRIINPGGVALSEWLNHFQIGTGYQSSLAMDWLDKWGLDIKRLSLDHEARNLSSYRPTAISSSRALDPNDALLFIQDLWNNCEPSNALRFPWLDRHILRLSLSEAFRNTHNRTYKQAPRMYEAQVKRLLHAISPTDIQDVTWWEEFLTYKNFDQLPEMLREAKGTLDSSHPRHHLQVMARAILLLRIATGASHTLITSMPEFDRADLSFWWSKIGEDRGLWHPDAVPDSFIDLWTDILEAIRDILEWQDQLPMTDETSYQQLWSSQSAPLSILGSSERIGLWGIGL